MKIKIKQLRQVIREVALSPSLKKNNKPLDNPMHSQNVATLVQKLEAAFENALSLDLVVRMFDDHYNPDTREFDDDVYEQIKNIVSSAKEKAAAAVQQGLEASWAKAHEDQPNPAQSGVHRVAA